MPDVLLEESLTNDLYHYTGADVAIYNILDQGTLRLSPYEFTNDPEENRPKSPTLSWPHGASEDRDSEEIKSIWKEADWWLRRYVKVACLTQDFEIVPSNYASDADALRGWAHPALWAHYGARHGGVCLRFDRSMIIDQFKSQMSSKGPCFYGAVEYPFDRFIAPPDVLNIGQVREFGVDAVTSFYIEKYHRELFFTKHHDWANEREFRLVLNEPSLMPAYLDIRSCLTGMVLGAGLPSSMLDRIHDLRRNFGELDIYQLVPVNGRMMLGPISSAPARSSISARRDGALATRLEQLRVLEEQRKYAQVNGQMMTADLLSRLASSISATQSICSKWGDVETAVDPRGRAIPPEQRGNRPGVPGEVVEFENGSMCVVENLPKYSYTLLIGLAIQLLDTKIVRLHGSIELEKWLPTGNEWSELWRASYEAPIDDAASKVDVLIQELESQIAHSEEAFNASRSQ